MRTKKFSGTVRGLLAAATFIGVTASASAAYALGCVDIGGVAAGDDCTLSVAFNCSASPTTIDIVGDLTIAAAGSINCNGSNGSNGANGANGAGGADGATGTMGSPNGTAGGPGSGGGTGTAGGNATVADDLVLNVGGSLTINGPVSANGANGGNGGNGGTGGIGGSGGTGFTDGGNGGNGGNGGIGGTGGLAGNCTDGGDIEINAAFGGSGGEITIASTVASNGGNGAHSGMAGGGGVGGLGGLGGSAGTASGSGGAAGAGGNGGNGTNGTPGCTGGLITFNEDFTVTAAGSIQAKGGIGGNGGKGGNGGNGNTGGSGSSNMAPSFGGNGGAGGNGGNGGNCANGGAGGTATINSSGSVNIDGSMLTAGGAAGTGGALGTGGTGGLGGVGLQGNGSNGSAGSGGSAGLSNCTAGTNGANNINHCDEATVDTVGATITPAATVTPNSELCKFCQIQITKKVAPDTGCNKAPDGPFGELAMVMDLECVIYEICVTNTGDEPLEDVTVDDPDLGITMESFGDLAPAGQPGDEVCKSVTGDIAADACSSGDCICQDVEGVNTVSVGSATCGISDRDACQQDGSDCDDIAQVTCGMVSEICRTPGFWATHAGVDPKKAASQNITQQVITAGGGCLEVCGEIISNTNLNDAGSTEEAMCVPVKGASELQLARQLTAAKLNCIMSGGGVTCDGVSVENLVNQCNSLCGGPSFFTTMTVTECIDAIDCFNNGGENVPDNGGLFCKKGTCSDNGEPCNSDDLSRCDEPEEAMCIPTPNTCHDQPLVNEDLGLDFDPPGPAGSSKKCNDANKSKCHVIPPGESECGADTGACPGPSCCAVHAGTGCEVLSCQNVVCAIDPFCCNNSWDSICVGEAESFCGALCD